MPKRFRENGRVGGEPAERILAIGRSFTLSRDFAGQIVVHNTASLSDTEVFQRAYDRVEFEVLVREESCPRKALHRTLSEAEHRWMILTDLMIEARIAANDFATLDGLWSIRPGTSALHSEERLRLRGEDA